MRILFLDFDGVLNPINPHVPIRRSPNWAKTKHPGYDWIHAKQANILAELFEKVHDLFIVVSSAWRSTFTLPELQKILEDENPIFAGKVIDTTQFLWGIRGDEIARWLESCDEEFTHYAIVDDINDMMPHQQHLFVQTNHRLGITKQDTDKLYEILTR